MKLATLILAAIAALMLVGYLVRRPPLGVAVRLWLLAAVGAFPIGAAMTGNVAGYQFTQQREFCGSCHSMEPYARDAADLASSSLAAMHSRNEATGDTSCYTCHRDYGMYGTVTTKLAGLKHVWIHYTRGAPEKIRLYRPYPNRSCTHCHSMALAGFRDEPEHAAVEEDLRKGTTSCASAGCHGPPHPLAQGSGS